MIQVQAHSAIADLHRFVAIVPQALAKFTIEATILHVFVKAVYRNQVFGPGRAVHAVPAGRCRGYPVHEVAETAGGRELPEFVVLWLAVGHQPLWLEDLA